MGLLYSRIEDYGPNIEVNLSKLDETQTLALAVQTFTILGAGTGSRSAFSYMDHAYGPLPVPTGQLIDCIIYPFLLTGEASSDPRIRRSGRICSIIVLVRRQMENYDILREFLQKHVPKWLPDNQKISIKALKKLSDVIHKQTFMKPASINNEYYEGNKSDEELKQIITNQQNRLLIMEQIINLETLSKSLINLLDTVPNPTINQLSKLAGISRLMLNFHLRKYVKAGIITIENNVIQLNSLN